MKPKLAVIIIHGIGTCDTAYADPMIEAISRKITTNGYDSRRVVWKPVYWADIFESRQSSYLDHMGEGATLNYNWLRKHIVNALGDAAGYQKVNGTSPYEKVHCRIDERVKELFEKDLYKTSVPVIVMAHSIGGHILVNYLEEKMNSGLSKVSDFERLQSLTGIITFGCNIPLFSFAHDKEQAIEFPPKGLHRNLRNKAKWLNFYDPNDILAYPLKRINDVYYKVVDEDIAINVGNILTSWNPACHNGYWTDDDFTEPVAKFMTEFL